MNSNFRLFAAAMISLGCAAADLASAQGFTICAEHYTASGDLNLTLSTGCVSSSIPYLGQDLAVEVVQERALIKVTGGFNYKKLPAGTIGTTDCGGGRSIKVALPGVDRRRFHVMHGDEYAGLLDLTEASGRLCAEPVFAGVVKTPVLMSANWQPVDYSAWEHTSAPTLMGVLEPLYQGHPESMEGAPAMELKMAQWPGEEAMQVVITMTGYLDDSVDGEKYVAHIQQGGDGWKITGLWKRNLCVRGKHAGQWIAGSCL